MIFAAYSLLSRWSSTNHTVLDYVAESYFKNIKPGNSSFHEFLSSSSSSSHKAPEVLLLYNLIGKVSES